MPSIRRRPTCSTDPMPVRATHLNEHLSACLAHQVPGGRTSRFAAIRDQESVSRSRVGAAGAAVAVDLPGNGHLPSIGARFQPRKCPLVPRETIAETVAVDPPTPRRLAPICESPLTKKLLEDDCESCE